MKRAGGWRLVAAVAGAALALALVVVVIVPVTLRGPSRRALGEERAFGALDPHLRVTVAGCERVGPGVPGTTRWSVRVRVRNDAARIDVRPSILAIAVVDGNGREHRPAGRAATGGAFAERLPERVAAGRDIAETFAFDLPDGAAPSEVMVWTDDPIGRLLPRVEANPLIEMMRVPLPTAARAVEGDG